MSSIAANSLKLSIYYLVHSNKPFKVRLTLLIVGCAETGRTGGLGGSHGEDGEDHVDDGREEPDPVHGGHVLGRGDEEGGDAVAEDDADGQGGGQDGRGQSRLGLGEPVLGDLRGKKFGR